MLNEKCIYVENPDDSTGMSGWKYTAMSTVFKKRHTFYDVVKIWKIIVNL